VPDYSDHRTVPGAVPCLAGIVSNSLKYLKGALQTKPNAYARKLKERHHGSLKSLARERVAALIQSAKADVVGSIGSPCHCRGMAHNDAERFRKQAEEAREHVARALSPLDKEAWLRVAEEWLKLAVNAEQRDPK
jgi:hypothetical protein